ncbi:DUF1775 domain-containing protein [Amorphoplanes digitatis]|uniref:Uncharacterized protein YcnI n=1 Tax=Actinoplanes digitatis TaxID=1868 RepID=A0A7W7HXJ4_9ACTN|nr:DUF1775 domain-containing protein [Actinoplanes digitatis]MBB4762609.1 uncharacterized protein YcnI [Actinoplanes digitatis]GID91890.1 hypothetical protein Adi01nite_13020 [Actinoplanes digitatis]
MRYRSRLTTISALAALAVLALAAPAAAHVEVSADKAHAGATDVTLSFQGEAENPSGIVSERVVLPAGIAPADVTPVKTPAGWEFATTSDGFTVGGKALPANQDAEWSVKVALLPADQTRLSFKTLETYADGEVSRWIEIQEEGAAEPANPAPLLVLQPGPPVASAPATESSPPEISDAPTPQDVGPVPTESADGPNPVWMWWMWAVFAVVLVGGVAFGWRYFHRNSRR